MRRSRTSSTSPGRGRTAWSLLPSDWARALHEGLLANDVVGFHTHRWREHFLDSVAAILGEVDLPLVTAHPISVDTREFDELARSDEVLAAGRELERIRCERTVLRVDRTDPTKNIARGFEAFGLYLERHPEAHGRVGMLALLDPSRQDIPLYAAYVEAVADAARAVNERFGEDGWLPIRLEIKDDFPRSVAAYKHYDVLLVNAISDGLNLVAKEAPLVNERNGVVILSENAGAWEELGALGGDDRPLRRRGPGGGDSYGARAAGRRAGRARRGDPRPRARARPRRVAAAQLADLDRVSAAA